MVNYGLDQEDVSMSMEEEYAFSEAANAFGPNEFANALSNNLNAHGPPAQTLLGKHGLLNRYQRIAQDKAKEFREKQGTSEYWTLESRLWDVFQRLYTLRHSTSTTSPSSLEETSIILQWLLDTAPRVATQEYIQSNRWFVTRENIKMRKLTSRQQPSYNDPIISELDPDAPLRQGKGLMSEDEENERKLLRQIFMYLRMGDLKGAQQVCRDTNNYWRAASISGKLGQSQVEEGKSVNGLWRKMCFGLCRQAQMDRFERAIYGVVCGDLDSVLPVCESWEDWMWAHFNAVWMWKVDEKARQDGGGKGDGVIGNFDGVTADVILERLHNSASEKVNGEAKHSIRNLIGHLITGDIDGMIDYINSLPSQLSGGRLAFMLRLSSHILLAMRALGVPHNEQAANDIIKEYVYVLMHYHVDDHIALYSYHLPRQLGIETYALFLSTIESEQRRLRQLENAQRYNLDTADIIRHTMKLTLQQTQSEMEELFAEQGQPILAVPLNDPITTLDETQIRAIEWVLLASQEDLTLDCLMNGNILFRRFLLAGHLNSVKALAERVPAKNLIRPETMQSEDTIEGALGQHALEYAQHSALWEFFASFDRWEEFALQYMNAAHSHRDRLAERQYKNETKAALEEFMQRAKSMVLGDEGLNAVLDDVGKGDDQETYVALGRIRDLYVPEIVLRMHEVFVWGGENLDAAYLEEAFDLAAAVADSGAKLHECFRATNQLEDYLTKIKELSIISLKPENLGTGIGTGLTT